MQILTIDTSSLGDRSYVVHDGRTAAVIDPQRDIDRLVDLLDAHNLQLVAVLETHLHNDYVTGGHELSRRLGAAYHVPAELPVAGDVAPLLDGEVVAMGSFTLRALHTPGHTPTHLAYVANDGARDVAVFTGGSLLYGSVGRTDLISAHLTEELTRLQHRSARRLASELADDVEVRPTHGFGSFCSAGDITGSDSSTVGTERRRNQALTIEDEDAFVRRLTEELDAYPAYYAHMAELNRTGPPDVDLSPARVVDTAELLRRVDRGEWVVDLRPRTAFAAEHLRGTINLELSDKVSTYVGWLIPWATPVTLLADSPKDVARVQRQLVRIGIDRPAGQVPDGLGGIEPSAARGRYGIGDFSGLRAALDAGPDVVVLDTRRDLEWADGHLPMAVHLPLHELQAGMSRLPAGQLWVHCASGYRAAIAASLLARSGRDVVLVDDSFDRNAPRHFDLVRPRG